MEEMKKLLEEINENFKKWNENSQEELQKFKEFLEVVEKPKVLSTKTKELISLSIAVVKHCKWCIAFHVKNCIDAGASEEEIREAAWIGVLMDGGPALMYMQLVEKALEEFKRK